MIAATALDGVQLDTVVEKWADAERGDAVAELVERNQTENLQLVADAYRAAMAQGSRNPRKYVAKALYISESTASRRIRAARDHDPPLLGGALGKKPGEAPLPPEEDS